MADLSEALRSMYDSAGFEALLDSAYGAIITVDDSEAITGWNRGAEGLFGYTFAECFGRPILGLFPERCHPRYRSAPVIIHPSTAARGSELELRGRRKDGSEFPLGLKLVQWTGASGPVRAVIIRDLSERKAVEERMRLQSMALEAAVNSVVITDARGTIQWVNPAFCRVSGYTMEEVLGHNPKVLKSGRQSPEYYANMWSEISQGRSWHGEFVNRRKDGTEYTESVAITPVLDECGRPAHFIAIKADITALKRSMAELETAHAELNEKNQALDRALVEARAAVEAKALFLATMSHEIRTPMNGVIGATSLLRETTPLLESQVELIDMIKSSGDALLTIINDILDFSKIESNRVDLECVPFDLRRCVEETLEAFGPRAREKRLDLTAEVGGAVPAVVMGDSVRLRQVLTNLVGNAIKFTAAGEVALEITEEFRTAGHVRLLFRVRDTGIGIPPDKIDRLFKAFSQVDSSTTRIYGGSGLGLAISQRLVHFMGGNIAVDSSPGRGSVFSFALDLPVGPTANPSPHDLTGRTILVVDDNPRGRRVLAAHLSEAGATVLQSESAAAALGRIRDHLLPDVAIVDMLMPDRDGLDFALDVRAWEKSRGLSPPLPVLLVSSTAIRPNDPRVLSAGLAAVTWKPLRRGQLLDNVARICAKHTTPRPAQTAGTGDALVATAARHPRQILLAEDNLVNRRVALAMLARLGYEATPVANGGLAVEAVVREHYDLVLMDVQMPEMDGLEATKRIRKLAGPQPVIVAMTANAMAGDRDECLAAGMDDYIAKPIRLEDLRRVLSSTARAAPHESGSHPAAARS